MTTEEVRSNRSAGVLVYRTADAGPEVLIAHMGGPFFARKDDGAWSIPKGEYLPPEQALDAARREFEEEMGSPPPAGDYLELGEAKQSNGKIVTTYAVEGDYDLAGFVSNTFTMEWPRGSGRIGEFPEMDRAGWFDLETAKLKLVKAQGTFIDRLQVALQS